MATLICYTVVLASFGVGFRFGARTDAPGDQEAGETRARIRASLESAGPADYSSILWNNVRAMVAILALGLVSAGLFGVLQMAHFGFVHGLGAGSLHQIGLSGGFLAAYHLTHGIPEVFAFALASGVGLQAGAFFLRYLRRGTTPQPPEIRSLVYGGALAFGLLPICALIEVYVTPVVSLARLG